MAACFYKQNNEQNTCTNVRTNQILQTAMLQTLLSWINLQPSSPSQSTDGSVNMLGRRMYERLLVNSLSVIAKTGSSIDAVGEASISQIRLFIIKSAIPLRVVL